MTEERFKITDDDKANWAFRKLAEKEAELNEINEKADARVAQDEAWRERKAKPINDDIEYFKSLINEYRETLEDKKVDVPAGQTITTHSKSPVYDDDVLLNTVKDKYPEFIKQTVAKGDLKKTLKPANGKWVDKNGEIVEGMTYEEKETVTFKPNKLEV